ncbi:hypothetical protein VC83_03480 [Pseudogymnoascus destructans]|uniref:Uncharacterized protein n=1 Tax=Pseudogymnoascus destructans TaxID=655981 RepID=A0A177AH32_9PEZI|nr:uncharacterized protein VC83_03480 [Pseudogymnoascus destructans]OAF60732.1 hypothetical protein VC83_03480 [Pseudogymnoascus destructans]
MALRTGNVFGTTVNEVLEHNAAEHDQTIRIEPILQTLGQKWIKTFFQADGANGFWAIPLHHRHIYKTGFSTHIGQMAYLRMGQGLTGAPSTYSKAKDIITGPIPEPFPEPDTRQP